MRRVVVVGAGLAGLSCAYRLQSAGLDPVVLEARDRVGGRTWSVSLSNGEVAELGGEWIHSDQKSIAGLAADLGVDLAPIGTDFSIRDAVGLGPIDATEHARVARTVSERLARLSPDQRRDLPASQILAGVDGPAADVLRSRLEGSAGRPLGEVAVDEIDGDFGVGTGDYSRVAAGNQTLCAAMADRLVDVRLSTPVVSVRTGGVGLANGHGLRADAVVVAVPLPIARSLEYTDVVEPVEVMRRLAMGSAAKMALETSSVPPIVARQDVDVPIWYWTGRGETGSVRRLIASYAGTDSGVERAMRHWAGLVGAAVPEVDVVGEPVTQDWTADRWTLGSYSCLGPGQRDLLEAFERPHGRVVFAGEHTNGTGTMDGAIASGNRAARLVAELIR
jgi:monoamine oxidase